MPKTQNLKDEPSKKRAKLETVADVESEDDNLPTDDEEFSGSDGSDAGSDSDSDSSSGSSGSGSDSDSDSSDSGSESD